MHLSPRPTFVRTTCALAAVAAITTSPPAAAGRAQAGGNLGIYSESELANVLITGQAWDDGVRTQSVLVTAEPAVSGGVHANRNGQTGVHRARVEIAGEVRMLQPGGAAWRRPWPLPAASAVRGGTALAARPGHGAARFASPGTNPATRWPWPLERAAAVSSGMVCSLRSR